MRTRRHFELQVLPRLPLPVHLIDVSSRDREGHRRELTAALEESLAPARP